MNSETILSCNDSDSSNRPERWKFTERDDDDEIDKASTSPKTVRFSNGNSRTDRQSVGSEVGLARNESRNVLYSKILVIFVLCAAAAVVAFATYDLTQKEAEHAWIASVSALFMTRDTRRTVLRF